MWLDRYGAQAIEADDLSAVAEALASGVLTQGASVEAFESRVASYCGAEFAIAVCNATAGLHIALLAAGVGAGDEVITTPISFAATANAVLYCGATPIFADIDFASGLLDAACVERLITPRTKAIIPVHYAGSLCDLAIYEIAARRALIVIEDAAHAIGSFDAEGKSAGTFGAMGVFSFHPVKPITTGEGGAVITNDPAIAARLRLLRSHGISRGEGWEQNMNLLGFNYRISDISCALGVSQIAKLDRMIDARSQVAAKYDRAFESAAKFRPLKIPAQSRRSRHLYPILLDESLDKKTVFERLKSLGIGAQSHYKPIYSHPFYREKFPRIAPLLNAEKFYAAELSLPCHVLLDDREVDFVIKTMRKIEYEMSR